MFLPMRRLLDDAIGEKDFAEQMVALGRLLDWTVEHTWLSVRSPAGFPDQVLAKPGRSLILAERKSERGRCLRTLATGARERHSASMR